MWTPGGRLAAPRRITSAAPTGASGRSFRLLVGPDTVAAQRTTTLALAALCVVAVVLTLVFDPTVFPVSAVVVPVVLAGLLLPRRPMLVVVAVALLGVLAEVLDKGWREARVGSVVVVALVAAIAYELAGDRERLGLSAGRGEAMLFELREHLRVQGELPRLPSWWEHDLEQRSAGASTFGGDFLVSTLTGPDRLELALVDVSGKGVDAGTRALQLAGALGGLLGAVPAAEFLPAANNYLLRQEWDEGFATAVHLVLDLRTGAYRITNAGHPPAVHYSGGSGRWELVEVDGMALGLMPDATFSARDGVLRPQDAVLLYTDGLVEVPGRDIAVGVDRLLGEAERLLARGFAGGAARLVDTVAPHATDDRALLLLWRT